MKLSPIKLHFVRMAMYHKFASNFIFQRTSQLPPELLTKDLQMYFLSIHGTLVHIFLGDWIWYSRLLNIENPFLTAEKFKLLWSGEDQTQFQKHIDYETLVIEQNKICDKWIQFTLALKEEELFNSCTYQDSRGTKKGIELMYALGHIFNHGTHHRGQITDQLHKLNVNCDRMDLLYFQNEINAMLKEYDIES